MLLLVLLSIEIRLCLPLTGLGGGCVSEVLNESSKESYLPRNLRISLAFLGVGKLFMAFKFLFAGL